VRKSVFIVSFIFFFSLVAETLVVLPPASSKSNRRFAKLISKNIRLFLKSIKGMNAVYYVNSFDDDDVDAIDSCRFEYSCYRTAAKSLNSSDYVLVYKLVVDEEIPMIAFTIYKAGVKLLKTKTIEGFDDSDDEDLAADLLSKINRAVKRIKNRKKEEELEKESSDADIVRDRSNLPQQIDHSKSRALTTGDSNNRRENLSKGFSVYKQGDLEGASDLLYNSAAADVVKDIDELRKSLRDADEQILDKDFDRAISTLELAAAKDSTIRKKGYNKLKYKKSNINRYVLLSYGERERKKVLRIHKKFRTKFDDILRWKQDRFKEIDLWLDEKMNLEKKYTDQLKEKKSSIEDEKIELKKEFEKRNQKIEDNKNAILKSYDRNISDLEKKLADLTGGGDENEKNGAEKYSDKKKTELDELERSKKSKLVKLEKKKSNLVKKGEEKKAELRDQIDKSLKELQKNREVLEKSIRKFEKELIDNENSVNEKTRSYDSELEKEREELAKRLEIKLSDIEKKTNKKRKDIEGKLVTFEKKYEVEVEHLERAKSELDSYSSKHEMTVQKIKDSAEIARRKIEDKFGKDKQNASEAAELEYEKSIKKIVDVVEGIESDISVMETNDPKYEKKKMYKKLQKNLRNANRKLNKAEEGHDKFIAKFMDPINRKEKNAVNKSSKSFALLIMQLKKETKDYYKFNKRNRNLAKKKLKRLKKKRVGLTKKIKRSQAALDKKRVSMINSLNKNAQKKESSLVKKFKKKKAEAEATLNTVRSQIKDVESEISKVSSKIDKLADSRDRKIEKFTISIEKKIEKSEIAFSRKVEKLETQYERKRGLIVEKYEKKELSDRAKQEKKQKKIEKKIDEKMAKKALASEKALAALGSSQKRYDKSLNRLNKKIEKAEIKYGKKIVKASESKDKFQQKAEKKRKIAEGDYIKKIDVQIDEEIESIKAKFKQQLKKESSREIEISASTLKIGSLLAKVYLDMAVAFLERNDFSSAWDMVGKSLYFSNDKRNFDDGLKLISRRADELLRQIESMASENKDEAISILGKLKELPPWNEYFIKAQIELDGLNSTTN